MFIGLYLPCAFLWYVRKDGSGGKEDVPHTEPSRGELLGHHGWCETLVMGWQHGWAGPGRVGQEGSISAAALRCP